MADLRGGTTVGGYLVLHKGNPNELLDTLNQVSGVGSGLDADKVDGMQASTSNVGNTIVARDASGNFAAGTITATLSGNASTASKFYTPRLINITGDVTGSSSAFDGSADVNISVNLSNTGITAGSYSKVTVDAKGRVTAGTTLASSDVPVQHVSQIPVGVTTWYNHSSSSYTDAAIYSRDNTEDGWIYLDKSNAQYGVYHRQIDSTLTVASNEDLPMNSIAFIGNNTLGAYIQLNTGNAYFKGTVKASITGNAGTATKWATSRSISLSGDLSGSVSGVDGSADVAITTTLANSGVTAGTYNMVTVDAKGRVTSGQNYALTGSDLPASGVTAGTYTKVTVNNKGIVTSGGLLNSSDLPTHQHSAADIASGTLTIAQGGTGNTSFTTNQLLIYDGSKLVSSGTTPSSYLQLSGGTMTGALTLNADPTNALHAATKQYVDNVLQGLDVKQSVKVATTANITLSGVQTIDGISLVAGDRVLVKDQTTASQNGIYIVNASTWTRSTDADNGSKVNSGMYVFVEQGSTNADSGWVLITDGAVTLGTTALAFQQFSGAGQISVTGGISKTGNTLSLTDTGVSAGTWTKVTVDTKGRITSGAAATASDIGAVDKTGDTMTGYLTFGSGAGIYGGVSNSSAKIWAYDSNNPNHGIQYFESTIDELRFSASGNANLTNADFTIVGDGTLKARGNTIWHAGNDGIGSGLDADLLDGYQTSATAVAGTIPVRNGSAQIVGDITGNAATASSVAWSGVSSKPTTVDGYGITDALKLSGGTMTGSLTVPKIIQNFGTNMKHYPNVSSYSDTSAGVTGAIIIHSPIVRNSNTMFVIRVHGYLYGISKIVDFQVCAYSYSGANGSIDGAAGAINSYSMVDTGNDGLTKRIGIDASGNVAISIGDTGTGHYYPRISVDLWSTLSGLDLSTGWTVDLNTTTNFGWKDLRTLTNSTSASTVNGMAATSANTALTIVSRDGSGNFAAGNITATTFTGSLTGNADTATKLVTGRSIALSGDVSGSVTFDGSANATITTTLANSGVTAGTYKSVTVDAKGRVTGGTNPTTLSAYGITDALNIAGGTLTGFLTLANDPTNPLHAVTKQYVDNLVMGLDPKGSVRAATTGNITLSGLQTIDGVALAVNDRVLVKDQTNQTQNGIYTAQSGVWVRTIDANSGTNITSGMYCFVEEGTLNQDTGWVLTTSGPVVIGTTNLTFTQFTGSGNITTGTGITKDTNNVLSLTSGVVSPGTYKSVTVDTYGRVTSGTNPTTLSSYGITDAVPSSDVVTTATANKILKLNGSSQLPADITGNAATATKLAVSRTLSLTGDVTGSTTFDGSGNASIATTSSAFLKLDGSNNMSGRINMQTTLGQVAAPHAINWYSSSYYTWMDYMAPNGTNTACNGLAGATYGGVTTWARRTNIENTAGYGWIWESGPNNNTVAPTAMMALTSDTGNLTVRGSITASSFVGALTGNSGTATKLATARNISATGDATWTVSFDGSADVSAALTLANSGVTAGTYKSVTVDAKGRVTAGTNPTTLSGYGITDAVSTSGGTISGQLTSTLATGTAPFAVTSTTKVTNLNADYLDGMDSATTNTANTIVARDASGNFSAGTITAALSGNASTATKWATARSISFTGDATGTLASIDGSANVSVAMTLANTAVTAGTYTKVTVDAKGRVIGSGTLAITDLPNSGATAGSYSKVTVNAQGLVTAGSALADTDIPSLTHDKISDFDTGVRTNTLNQMAVPTAAVSMNSQKITNLADPTSAQDAATKNYVDNAIQGLDTKQSVRAATTANITMSGAQTIDGIALVVGDRVLVKDQIPATTNGIWIVQSSTWTRATDADTWTELVSSFVFVEQGTVNADTGWVCTIDPGGTLGTTSITWVQFSSAGSVTGDGTTITKSGNTLSMKSGVVTAGTYGNVTVDTYGRVTGINNGSTVFAPYSHVGSGGTAHSTATTSTDGFMSASDKQKLDNLSSASILTNPIVGTASFVGYYNYVEIPFNVTASSTNYAVSITPTGTGSGNIGEIWVIKTVSYIRVYNTGSSTVAFDYLVLPATSNSLVGSGSFSALSAATNITFGSAMANTNYRVFITPTSQPNGNLGECWVIKSTTGFAVYNTGSSTGSFDWLVLY